MLGAATQMARHRCSAALTSRLQGCKICITPDLNTREPRVRCLSCFILTKSAVLCFSPAHAWQCHAAAAAQACPAAADNCLQASRLCITSGLGMRQQESGVCPARCPPGQKSLSLMRCHATGAVQACPAACRLCSTSGCTKGLPSCIYALALHIRGETPHLRLLGFALQVR